MIPWVRSPLSRGGREVIRLRGPTEIESTISEEIKASGRCAQNDGDQRHTAQRPAHLRTISDAGRVGVVRGYRQNLYTAGLNRASGCWCKEKSSTVNERRKLSEAHGGRFQRARFASGGPAENRRQDAGATRASQQIVNIAPSIFRRTSATDCGPSRNSQSKRGSSTAHPDGDRTARSPKRQKPRDAPLRMTPRRKEVLHCAKANGGAKGSRRRLWRSRGCGPGECRDTRCRRRRWPAPR